MTDRRINGPFVKAALTVCFALIMCFAAPQVTKAGQPDSEKILNTVRQDILSTLTKMDKSIASAARVLSKAGIKSKKARAVISKLHNDTPYAVDCITIDQNGKIIIAEPEEFKKFEGSDISIQEQIIKLQKTKMRVIGNVFRAVEGFDAVDFEYPIFLRKQKFIGSISILFKPEALIGEAVKKAAANAPLEIWAMQTDGRIIYDNDSEEIGRMLFTDPLYQPYTSLLELGKRIAAEPEGTGEYVFLAKGHKETIKKNVVWKTVALHDMQWRLVAVTVDHGELSKDVIRMGLVTKQGSAQNICAEKFRELLESRSSYKVRIYDNGSLGSENAILRQIQNGTIQMGVITSAPVDEFVPAVRVIEYPFLFKNYSEADALLDGAPGKKLLASLEKAGFAGIAFSENGFRHLTNNKRTVHNVADVKGLKIRVMESDSHRAIWSTLGTSVQTMGWPINRELKQGKIDGQENPLSVIWTYKLFESQKYLTLTSHVYSAHIDLANLPWFNSQPEKDRQLISQCMLEAAKYERKWNRDNEAGFLSNLKKAGMIVDESPDIESFKQKLAGIRNKAMYQEPAVKELLNEFLSK